MYSIPTYFAMLQANSSVQEHDATDTGNLTDYSALTSGAGHQPSPASDRPSALHQYIECYNTPIYTVKDQGTADLSN